MGAGGNLENGKEGAGEEELRQGLCHEGTGPTLGLSLILGKSQLENHL